MSFVGHFRKDFKLIFRDSHGLFIGILLPVLTLLTYSFLDLNAWTAAGRDPDAFILAISVSFPSFLLAKSAVLREREQGTFQRIGQSPTSMFSFISSKSVAALLLIAAQTTAIFAVAAFTVTTDIYRIGIETATILILTGLASHALGLIISSVCGTENQASQLSSLVFLLMLILSGFLRPLEGIGLIGRIAEFSPMALGYSGMYAVFIGRSQGIVGHATVFIAVYAAFILSASAFSHMRR